MYSKSFVIICLQLTILNNVYSQCLNRVLPNCGPNLLPVSETIIPNQLLLNQLAPNQVLFNQVAPNQLLLNQVAPNQLLVNQVAPNFIPAVGPNLINFELPYETVVPSCNQVMPTSFAPNQVLPGTTTIIQDSTVANNLANALQLLVVSNLLSNTLPSGGEMVYPGYGNPVEVVGGNLMSPIGFGGVSPCGGFNYVY